MNPFNFQVRVYYEDIDIGGVVYYANYLRYFERARSEWLRSLGVNQERLAAVEGIGFVVARAEIDFKAGARLDDLLDVSVSAGGEEEDLFLAGTGSAPCGRAIGRCAPRRASRRPACGTGTCAPSRFPNFWPQFSLEG